MKPGNLRFGNFNSYDDYLLHISELEIGQPTLKQIYVDIPYRNGSIDFTDLYGVSSYEDRIIKVKFRTSLLPNFSTQELFGMYDSIIGEIYGTGIQELEIDHIDGIFTGRVVSISPVTLFQYGGEINVEFRCNPFRVSKEYIGCTDIWDEFYPFNRHVFSDCIHDNVTSEITARLYNNSPVNIVPVITVLNKPVTVTQGTSSQVYQVGEHENTHVILYPNRWNEVKINSDGGSIRFKWKRIFI